MKLKRHEKIIELIEQYDIETQDELAELLRKEGFDVTQATVSRDIRKPVSYTHLTLPTKPIV